MSIVYGRKLQMKFPFYTKSNQGMLFSKMTLERVPNWLKCWTLAHPAKPHCRTGRPCFWWGRYLISLWKQFTDSFKKQEIQSLETLFITPHKEEITWRLGYFDPRLYIRYIFSDLGSAEIMALLYNSVTHQQLRLPQFVSADAHLKSHKSDLRICSGLWG